MTREISLNVRIDPIVGSTIRTISQGETTSFPLWFAKFDNSPRQSNTSKHKKSHNQGVVEWLRFIREFGHIHPGVVTDIPDGFLKIAPLTMLAPGFAGRVTYCENYGGSFRVFLNTNENWAVIEIDDPALFEDADKALHVVNESYR